jgi:hypothetical protein
MAQFESSMCPSRSRRSPTKERHAATSDHGETAAKPSEIHGETHGGS